MIVKEYLETSDKLPTINERVQKILTLFHNHGLTFDDTKITEEYFKYTDQIFNDLEDLSIITLEHQIGIINDLITLEEIQILSDRITEFEQLEYNWNGYGAEPIDPEIIKNSRRFLELIKSYSNVISVFPTAINAIQFEYEHNGIYCEIEIFDNDFEIFAIKGRTIILESSYYGIECLPTAATDFLQFLNKVE
jgi:hypothetical protein